MIYPVKKDCKMLLAGWRREVGSGSRKVWGSVKNPVSERCWPTKAGKKLAGCRNFFETSACKCWLKSKTKFCNAVQAANLAGVFAGREALHIYLPAASCVLLPAKFGILDI